jgi:hypothetical protein
MKTDQLINFKSVKDIERDLKQENINKIKNWLFDIIIVLFVIAWLLNTVIFIYLLTKNLWNI